MRENKIEKKKRKKKKIKFSCLGAKKSLGRKKNPTKMPDGFKITTAILHSPQLRQVHSEETMYDSPPVWS